MCDECGEKAINLNGESPFHDTSSDAGDNPLYINGVKVWRLYKIGGYITIFDEFDCADFMEFYQKHFDF